MLFKAMFLTGSHLYSFYIKKLQFVFVSYTGTHGGIRLYMPELIAITQKALQSQSWKMKAQGAAAMASLAKQTSSLAPPHLGMVLTALLQGLPGRTWTGKVKEQPAPNGSTEVQVFSP